MKYYLIAGLFVLFLGCQDDDTPSSLPLVNSYNFTNMHYAQGVAPSSNPTVTLEYAGNHIIKRIGGLRAMDEATGYNYMFGTEVSDTLIYSGNRIVIEEGRVLPWYPSPQSRTAIILDPMNRMIQRINLVDFPFSIDTIKYKYNTAGLLIQSSKGKLSDYHEVSDYSYNNENNLTSILSTRYYNATRIAYTVKETFSNYDNAYNPLRNLFLFKETFYRSLSKNNYMKYDMVQYDTDHNVMATEARNWNIMHDSNGNIIF